MAFDASNLDKEAGRSPPLHSVAYSRVNEWPHLPIG